MIYPEKIEHKIGFDGIRDAIRRNCTSDASRQRCDQMSFVADFEQVKSLLESVAEMLATQQSDQPIPMEGYSDIAALVKSIKVPGTYLAIKDLAALQKMLECIASVHAYFAALGSGEVKNPYPRLTELTRWLEPLPEVVRCIDRCIDKFGNVKDNASPRLAEIRTQLRSMSGRINALMRKVMASAISQGLIEPDTAPSMRDGRLVIPVSPMNKRKIQGIVHDESASGKTVFIEPAEIVETNNLTRELQIEERHEITKILISIADEIRPNIDSLIEADDILSHLDFIRAKATFAVQTDATLPHLSQQPSLEWYHACHPLLMLTLRQQGKSIVPLNITLTETDRILVISGPNAGGKSVCLKTVGVIQYMTQCGVLPTVYDNSHIGMFEDIFVDIGDDQSIEDDLSTYSSHLRNMKYINAHGGQSSLVLIDEFGGGTEPQIGGAIAQALLHRFNDLKMWGVITTHYQNLKHFADDTPGLINGSMLYDRNLMQPTFMLSIGTPGSSFAIEIARKTGLPAQIINEAEQIVGSDYIDFDNYLLDIARDKKYWENKRTAIRQKEKKLEALIQQYTSEAETLRQSRREIIDDARTQARKIIEGSNAVIERTIHEIKTAQAERQATIDARRKLADQRTTLEQSKSREHPLLKKTPRPKPQSRPAVNAEQSKKRLSIGQNVRLDAHGTVGTVIAIEGNNITVNFGNLRTTVKADRLTMTDAKPKSGAKEGTSFISAATNEAMRTRQLDFKQEIDIRGMRADEALQAVTYFIDDAIQFNVGRVRILHGTGTGALRQAVRQYLSTVQGVANFHDEDVRLGGAGITVVQIK